MNIDVLNIAMMVVSLILATIIPIELLVISYAFLGPLHYLTEINWLEDKNFFVKGKKWAWILVALTFALIIPPTINELVANGFLGKKTFENVLTFLGDNYEMFLFFGLMLSLILVFVKHNWAILVAFIAVIITSYLVYTPGVGAYVDVIGIDGLPVKDSLGRPTQEANNFYFMMGVFLPTIIHVFLFTSFFMLYGALKGKSNLGVISFFVLIMVPVFIFNTDFDIDNYRHITDYGNRAIRDSNFAGLNQAMISYFSDVNIYDTINQSVALPQYTEIINGEEVVFRKQPIHLKAQVFIAFAYIYHYMNWFSKTSVIKWHKSFSRKRVIAIVATYAIAIGLYIYDFKTGFIAMFFLSFLHVLLEFPLNVVSIKGIFEELGKRMGFVSTSK